MAAMVLGASIALELAVWCGGAPGQWLGAAAVGLLFAATYRTWREAAVLSAITGALGSALTVVGVRLAHDVPTPDSVGGLATAYTSNLTDVIVSIPTHPWSFGLSIVATALLAAVAVGLAIEHAPHRKIARVVAASLVVVCAFGSMWFGAMSTDMSRLLSAPPVAGTFRQDAFIYWKTYLNLTTGERYYPAFRDAAASDKLLVDNKFVVNGRFTGWAYSPASIRLPYSFYLWRYLAPGGGASLLAGALLLAGIVLAASLWAFMPRVGPAAALVPMLLMPYLQVSIVFGGLFLPDVWAALFVTLGFFAWIRKRYIAAGTLVLASALCRETAIFALIILLAWALWRALHREREWVARAVALGAMTAVFALAYWLHLRAGSPFIASSQTAGATIIQMLAKSAARSFSARFIAPSEFGFFTFLSVFIPSWLPLALQFLGWWVTLRSSRDEFVPVVSYAAFWVLFALTLGMSAAYWGALYMPLAITGNAALLAWAGMRGQQAGSPAPRA